MLLAVLGILVTVCISQGHKIDNYKQNKRALTDSIEYAKTKNGELEASKSVLVADNKTLKELNKNLSDELKKEKGTVVYINQTETVISHDTIYMSSGINDGKFHFAYDTVYSEGNEQHIAIDGEVDSSSVNAAITKNEIGVSLITGLKREDGVVKIFVRSDYPGFNVTKLEGAVVQQDDEIFKAKEKHFIIGPQIGVGVGRGGITPYIGAGLTYKIFAF